MSKKNQSESQDYHMECLGMDEWGFAVLEKPVEAVVSITRRAGGNTLSAIVECEYNTGGHGERCKASHPDVDKTDKDVYCPYGLDLARKLIIVDEKINRVLNEEERALLEKIIEYNQKISTLADTIDGQDEGRNSPNHKLLREYCEEIHELYDIVYVKAFESENFTLLSHMDKIKHSSDLLLRMHYGDVIN